MRVIKRSSMVSAASGDALNSLGTCDAANELIQCSELLGYLVSQYSHGCAFVVFAVRHFCMWRRREIFLDAATDMT